MSWFFKVTPEIAVTVAGTSIDRSSRRSAVTCNSATDVGAAAVSARAGAAAPIDTSALDTSSVAANVLETRMFHPPVAGNMRPARCLNVNDVYIRQPEPWQPGHIDRR